VTNTPDVLTDSTADLAIALMLGCARKIIEAENFVKEGKFHGWRPQLFLGTELKNKIPDLCSRRNCCRNQGAFLRNENYLLFEKRK
jgi:hypothetical protein